MLFMLLTAAVVKLKREKTHIFLGIDDAKQRQKCLDLADSVGM